MAYKILFTKRAVKDLADLSVKEKARLKKILENVISLNPYLGKKLVGDLKGNYSYRLSVKDRIVYSVLNKEKTVFVKRVRTHYSG